MGDILHQWLSKVLPEMHKKRLESLSTIVMAAMNGRQLTTTQLGRAIGGEVLEKHNIKRADRLLSNLHIRREMYGIYNSLARLLINNCHRLVIIVDWSLIDHKLNFSVLRAALAINGRALTIYEEVHAIADRESQKTQVNFLKNLEGILPDNVCPIIVTDAGFRKPWFKAVLAHGWDFVGRVRNTNRVKIEDRSVLSRSLYDQATNKPKSLGAVSLTERNPLLCNMVIYKSKKKTPRKYKSISVDPKKYKKSASEPWLLATSMDSQNAKEIVRIYSTRMQIEESFRDLKSSRYGLGFEQHRSYKKNRLAVLILISTIAIAFSWLLGKAAEILGIQRQFQSNSISNKTVLSTVFIGMRIFKKLIHRFNLKFLISVYAPLQQSIFKIAYVN